MKLIISFLLIALVSIDTKAQQNVKAENELSAEIIQSIVTDRVRKEFKILYPIRKGYQFTDRLGAFIYLLTEEKYSDNEDSAASSQKIKAVVLKVKEKKLYKFFEINDHTIVSEMEENSIWFWTQYTEFHDWDKDNCIDPIIVYGTSGLNGTDDGRIKIIIYYKGVKIAIRHQNGTLDYQRETKVDKTFYALPEKIQQVVEAKMELMVKDKNAIFPYGWQKKMHNKATFFSER